MEVSGQLHDLAALSLEKVPSPPTGKEVGWGPEPVQTHWRMIKP
jgi:hypothetical protein